ncbi:hypothetical protein BKA62DRAFT_769658 [Auriculariales sp. MPI-PUGE-AT-0066]|nr:hypothetical protein BKA62DRAFT_769658 [Auriculariales sp. MPI-PUGE-AT-0066]
MLYSTPPAAFLANRLVATPVLSDLESASLRHCAPFAPSPHFAMLCEPVTGFSVLDSFPTVPNTKFRRGQSKHVSPLPRLTARDMLSRRASAGADRLPQGPRRPHKMPRIHHVPASHPKVIGRENVRILEAMAEAWDSGKQLVDDDWLMLTNSTELESPVAPVPPHLLPMPTAFFPPVYSQLVPSVIASTTLADPVASRTLKTSDTSDKGPLLFDCPEDFDMGLDLDEIYPVPVWNAEEAVSKSEVYAGIPAFGSSSDRSNSVGLGSPGLTPPFNVGLDMMSSYMDVASLLAEDMSSIESASLGSPTDVGTLADLAGPFLTRDTTTYHADGSMLDSMPLLTTSSGSSHLKGTGLGLTTPLVLSSTGTSGSAAVRHDKSSMSPMEHSWISITDPWTGLTLM